MTPHSVNLYATFSVQGSQCLCGLWPDTRVGSRWHFSEDLTKSTNDSLYVLLYCDLDKTIDGSSRHHLPSFRTVRYESIIVISNAICGFSTRYGRELNAAKLRSTLLTLS